MALDKYNTGLLSVANGSDDVTIDGALLETWGLAEDDILYIPGFAAVYVSEVTGQETFKLTYPWGGVDQVDVAYTIMANPLTRVNAAGYSRMANSIRDLLAGIGGQPPIYRVLGSEPDDNIGEDNQIAFKVSGSTLSLWVKESGAYGNTITLGSNTYADGASINDTGDNELITFGVSASAVNNIKVANAATASAPKLSAVGGDSNIGLKYATKGTGVHTFEINSIAELELSSTYLRPASNDGLSLGDSSHGFSDLFFASGGAIDWSNDITATHSTDLLTFDGGRWVFNSFNSSTLPMLSLARNSVSIAPPSSYSSIDGAAFHVFQDSTGFQRYLDIIASGDLGTADGRVRIFANAGGGAATEVFRFTTSLNTSVPSLAAPSIVPTGSSAPANGMYLPASNTLGWACNSIAELQLNNTELFPASDTGLKLGTAAKRFDKLNDIDITSAANLFAAIKQVASIAASGVVQIGTHIREILSANRNYYVRSDGSDSNDGLTNSSGGAFLTIAKAIAVATALDLSVYSVTIQVGAGTWTVPIAGKSYIGAGPIYLKGDEATPSNVLINITSGTDPVFLFDGVVGLWVVSGFKFASSVSHGMIVSNSYVQAHHIDCGACPSGVHLAANVSGLLRLTDDYSISGGATIHLNTSRGGVIQANGMFGNTTDVTVTGTINFSNAFCLANEFSFIRSPVSFNISGATVTGTRYSAASNAVIATGGGGASFFPGDVSGSTATGGQYI